MTELPNSCILAVFFLIIQGIAHNLFYVIHVDMAIIDFQVGVSRHKGLDDFILLDLLLSNF